MSVTLTRLSPRPPTASAARRLPTVRSQCMSMTYDPPDEEALHAVRRTFVDLLDVWHLSEFADVVETAVAELYSNVIRHVRGDRKCTVILRVVSGVVQLTVRDADVTLPEIPKDPTEYLLNCDGESGRGLCMVAVEADVFRFERLPSRIAPGKVAIVEWGSPK